MSAPSNVVQNFVAIASPRRKPGTNLDARKALGVVVSDYVTITAENGASLRREIRKVPLLASRALEFVGKTTGLYGIYISSEDLLTLGIKPFDPVKVEGHATPGRKPVELDKDGKKTKVDPATVKSARHAAELVLKGAPHKYVFTLDWLLGQMSEVYGKQATRDSIRDWLNGRPDLAKQTGERLDGVKSYVICSPT